MKSKTKPEPTIRERAAALAVMASEVLLMVLEDPVAAVTPAAKTAKAPKPVGKRKGRPPMTEQQRAAAKAARKAEQETQAIENAKAARDAKTLAEAFANRPAAKLQPVTRESLAARSAAPTETFSRPAVPLPVEPSSYFTNAN